MRKPKNIISVEDLARDFLVAKVCSDMGLLELGYIFCLQHQVDYQPGNYEGALKIIKNIEITEHVAEFIDDIRVNNRKDMIKLGNGFGYHIAYLGQQCYEPAFSRSELLLLADTKSNKPRGVVLTHVSPRQYGKIQPMGGIEVITDGIVSSGTTGLNEDECIIFDALQDPRELYPSIPWLYEGVN